MAALGLAVCSSALAGPLQSEATAVCLLGAPARACGASIEAKFDASVSPKALAKSEQTPLSSWVSMSFKNSDGTHPPALKEFEIEEDRHLRLNLTGVPACHGLGIQDGIPLQQKCRGSLIGTGRMVVNIQFPEQEPIVTRSKVTAYNEGVGSSGTRSLLLAAYITVPTPAVIVTTVEVKNSSLGRYGLKLVGSVPKIAGGSGSVTYLAWRLHKGIFSATCADRHLQTGFKANFVDGTFLGGAVLQACTPAP
jgi:hypothetical protein